MTDIIKEVKRQIGSMQRQAGKANVKAHPRELHPQGSLKLQYVTMFGLTPPGWTD